MIVENRSRIRSELDDAIEEAQAVRLLLQRQLDRIDALLLEMSRDRLLDERGEATD